MNFATKYFNKIAYALLGVLIIFGVAYGYIRTKSDIQYNEIASNIEGYEAVRENDLPDSENIESKNVNKQNTISDDAFMTRKTTYNVCGHTIKETSKITKDIASLSEMQFRVAFNEWIVEKYSQDEIVISRRLNEQCPEHYIIKDKNGKVAVYYQKPVNGVTLKELTNIPVSSLSKNDQQKLKVGIKVESNEELAEILEDFGS